jgi:hypothetical protein
MVFMESAVFRKTPLDGNTADIALSGVIPYVARLQYLP